MKRLATCLFVVVSLVSSWAASGTVITGEISDSQCALNVHSKTRSHQEMTATHTLGTSSAECVRACVKQMGGQYVLVSGDKVYKLDQQEMADKYAGQKVRVKGGLIKKSGQIRVESIEPAGS